MREVPTYILVVKMPDDTQEEFIVYEPYEIGTRFKGGEIVDIRKITRKVDLD